MNLVTTHKKVHRKQFPRTIVVARPNIIRETDFTKIYIEGEGWIYLTAYLDLCSRKMKGHLVSRMSRTAEMIEAVDNIILDTFQDLKIYILRIRFDNGSQLTSSGYEKYLRTLVINHETIYTHSGRGWRHIDSYFERFRVTTYTQGNSSALMHSGNTGMGGK